MPIYEYRCSACGFQKEYLQKVTDPVRSNCPECGKPSFQKMLTAAGFQLKGSGWYATDFKSGSKPKDNPEKKPEAKVEGKSDTVEAKSNAASGGAGSSTTAAPADSAA